MRQTSLLLLLLLLLGKADAVHRAYLPLAAHPPCRAGRGLAWLDGGIEMAGRLRACHYYHSSSHREVSNGRAMPVIRPFFAIPAEDVMAELGRGYAGWLLALNEPPRIRQDEVSPQAAVAWVAWLREQLPLARLAGPNVVADEQGFTWLADYLAAGGRPFDAWGIHIYAGGCEPGDCLDRLCLMVTCEPGGVWITEIGYDHTRDDCHVFGEWLAALEADSRVEMIFGYTAVNGCCGGRLDFMADGALTCTGRQWLE